MKYVFGFFAALVLIAVVLAGAAYVYIEQTATASFDPQGKEQIIEVKKGASLSTLGTELESAGVIKNELIWKIYLKMHPGGRVTAGKHALSAKMTMGELVTALGGVPISEDLPLTMVEGWRIVDADKALTEDKKITKGAYIKAATNPARFKVPFPFSARTLEGYLYPETYALPMPEGQVDVEKLIQKQIDTFHERFFVPNQKEIEDSGRTLHQLVTFASLLEREEPNPELRPKVAGVLYNRLDSANPLGVDATSRYLLVEWNDRSSFLKALNNPNDPYNTRSKSGLPPTPIGSTSLPSLLAALRPEKSKYWYYLHDSNRQIHFGRNAKEHDANRAKYNVY